MSNTKCRTVSAKQMAANRRNALKSTGPRTAAGKQVAAQNSFRHGLYATPGAKMREQMTQLDEDPDQLARFERDLTESWAPENAMQALIVSDLARLYWKKSQLARTLLDARSDEKKIEAMEVARFTMQHYVGTVEIDEDELADIGYRQMEKSRPVYVECERLLTALLLRVEASDWSGDLDAILIPLYGTNPAPRGRRIINLIAELAGAEGETPSGPDGQYGKVFAELEGLLKQELASLALEQKLYQEDKKAVFTGSTGSAWLPTTQNWGRALDQDAKLSQQIERQSKLLMSLKRQRRARRGHSKAAEYAKN